MRKDSLFSEKLKPEAIGPHSSLLALPPLKGMACRASVSTGVFRSQTSSTEQASL